MTTPMMIEEDDGDDDNDDKKMGIINTRCNILFPRNYVVIIIRANLQNEIPLQKCLLWEKYVCKSLYYVINADTMKYCQVYLYDITAHLRFY